MAALLDRAQSRRPKVHEYWVGAERVTWNIAPNGRDGITGTTLDPFATVRTTTSTGVSTRTGARRSPTFRADPAAMT